MTEGTDSRPVPDPTILTTAQLVTAITSLRDMLEARINGVDKLIALMQNNMDARTGDIRIEFGEKLKLLATQISERDTTVERTSRDSKVAVDAAFAAAKEAVGEQNKSNALSIAKSEAAFTKQIDQIGGLISTIAKGVDDKIDDIKTRITTIETSKTVQTQGLSTMGTVVMGVLVGLSAVASVIAVAMAAFGHH